MTHEVTHELLVQIGLSRADSEFIFSKLDVDEDGKITKAEVKYNLTELAKVHAWWYLEFSSSDCTHHRSLRSRPRS